MPWREFRAYVTLQREDAEDRAAPGDPLYDPDHPERHDPRFGRPPPESQLRHIPWEAGSEPVA